MTKHRLRHAALLATLALGLGAGRVLAQSPDEVRGIITDRADAHGVSGAYLQRVASCETGGTYSPTAVGDSGNSLGIFQLNRYGLLPRFYAMGYGDPFNAWENADFAARMFAAGLASHWSCR